MAGRAADGSARGSGYSVMGLDGHRWPPIVAVVLLAASIVTLEEGSGGARIVAGLAVAFVLPGLLISLALWPVGTLDNRLRFVFAVTLSVLSMLAAGLAAGFGVRPITQVAAVVLVAVIGGIAGVVAIARARPMGKTFVFRDGRRRGVALLAGLLVVAPLGALLAELVLVPDYPDKYTVLAASTPAAVSVVVANHEGSPIRYLLSVRVGGGKAWSKEFVSSDGSQTSVTVPLLRAHRTTAHVELFRLPDLASVYRSLTLPPNTHG